MGILDIFKKKKELPSPVPPPVNDLEGIPLGLRVGAFIDIHALDYLIYESMMFMKAPREEGVVQTIGKIQIDDMIIWRCYIGIDGAAEDCMLQICEDNGVLIECCIFTEYDEIYPHVEEEWDIWMDDEDGHVGSPTFSLTEEDVTMSYGRTIANDVERRIDPIECKERIFNNNDVPTKEHGTYKHDLMMYSRVIEDSDEVAEYLILGAQSSGIINSVRIWVGMDIDPDSIKVT